MNKIITIGREVGSGGREFGRRLAETLNFQYYDKEIITEIAKKTDLSEEYISEMLEQSPNSLLPITIGHTINIADSYQLNQMRKIHQAQCDLLKTLAEKSNCVIVGRCADYLLKDYNPFRIFVHADIESRIKRCSQREKEDENLNKKQLKKKILKIDKNRAKYYSFITGNSWGSKENYDLTINTTDQNIKEIVVAIAKIFE